jgi:hypothetical protein
LRLVDLKTMDRSAPNRQRFVMQMIDTALQAGTDAAE